MNDRVQSDRTAMPVASILIAFVVPALVALAFFVLADPPWQRKPTVEEHSRDRSGGALRGVWGGAWGMTLAFVTGYWIIERQIFIWPDMNMHFLPHAALLAAVFGQVGFHLSTRVGRPWIARGSLAVLLAAGSALTLHAPGGFDPVWMTALMICVVLFWLITDWSAERCPGASLPLLTVPAGVGAAIIIMWAGEEQLARATGNVAAAAAAALIVAWWPGRTHRLNTTIGLPAALTVMLIGPLFMARAYTYSDIPWLSYLGPIAAIPAGMWFGEAPGIRSLPNWIVVLARLLVACALVAVAVALAWHVTDTSIY